MTVKANVKVKVKVFTCPAGGSVVQSNLKNITRGGGTCVEIKMNTV